MVFLCRSFLKNKKTGFIDHLRILVKGGAGGQGLPKYGGRGGRGGNVYIVAEERATLKNLISAYPKKRITAGVGANSKVSALAGASGENVYVTVPPGISVITDSGKCLGEVNDIGERVLLATGGTGGAFENNFHGQKGQQNSLSLDLKLIADIGLVGFPNAGKSTLLSAVSRATPKIASYPFTTLRPQLGTIDYEDKRQITMADLPGLIEGAHINVGMGHHFLKHIERTKLLLFVIDIHGFRLGPDYPHRDAFQTILLLMNELSLYKDDLLEKPAVLLLNKIDVEGSKVKTEEILEQVKHIEEAVKDQKAALQPEALIKFDDVMTISAKERINTDHLKMRLRDLLDIYADDEYSRTYNENNLAVIERASHEHHHQGGNML